MNDLGRVTTIACPRDDGSSIICGRSIAFLKQRELPIIYAMCDVIPHACGHDAYTAITAVNSTKIAVVHWQDLNTKTTGPYTPACSTLLVSKLFIFAHHTQPRIEKLREFAAAPKSIGHDDWRRRVIWVSRKEGQSWGLMPGFGACGEIRVSGASHAFRGTNNVSRVSIFHKHHSLHLPHNDHCWANVPTQSQAVR